jgi:hypothetical protein
MASKQFYSKTDIKNLSIIPKPHREHDKDCGKKGSDRYLGRADHVENLNDLKPQLLNLAERNWKLHDSAYRSFFQLKTVMETSAFRICESLRRKL